MKRTLAVLFFWVQTWSASASTFELYEVNDSTALVELWQSAGAEGDPAGGHYQILVQEDSTSKHVSLLREGTQAMLMPDFIVAMLPGRATRILPENAETIMPGDRELIFWDALKVPMDTVFNWMQWPTGLKVGWRSSFTSFPAVKPQIEQHLDFIWTQRPHRLATLDLGLHRSNFAGGLRHRLYNPLDTLKNFDYWGNAYWWWNVSVGVPGLKWELALADSPYPDFFWLDNRAQEAAQFRKNGSLIRQWKKGSTLPGNLSQTLHAKLGVLRYSMTFDFDAYRFPIQYFRLDDLPAPFGEWGFGFLTGRSTVFTRIWMDLFPLSFSVPHPETFPTSMRMAFLRFEFSFRNEQEYQIGLSTCLTLDNPALRLPGVQ